MCVDYMALNKVIVKNKDPVPLVQYLFDRLWIATYFANPLTKREIIKRGHFYKPVIDFTYLLRHLLLQNIYGPG